METVRVVQGELTDRRIAPVRAVADQVENFESEICSFALKQSGFR